MKTTEIGTLRLSAETAADLMTRKPISVRDTATLGEAVGLLADKGFSAAPVIDLAGRPVGVLSRSDILIHDRARFDEADAQVGGNGKPLAVTLEPCETDECSLVRDLMTPVVFSVLPDTAARRVVEDLIDLNVHQLFVVDHAGVLVGVISALDVLRHLQ